MAIGKGFLYQFKIFAGIGVESFAIKELVGYKPSNPLMRTITIVINQVFKKITSKCIFLQGIFKKVKQLPFKGTKESLHDPILPGRTQVGSLMFDSPGFEKTTKLGIGYQVPGNKLRSIVA